MGKFLYGFLFTVLLPAGLVLWAGKAGHAVSLPAVQSDTWGMLLFAAGVLLLLAGMYALWHYGKGLPMNAYPPPRFVHESVYRLVPHPIYTGFGLASFGAALWSGSAAGLWLVSPVAVLGCAALVWGFERPDLLRRFPGARRQYMLAIPPDEAEAPAWYHRLSAYVCLLLPWVLGNAAAMLVWSAQTAPPPVFSLPENMTLSGPGAPAAAALWVFLAPLMARTRQQLRRFFLAGLLGGATAICLAFLWPALGLAHRTSAEAGIWTQALLSFSWFWVWAAILIYENVFPTLRWPLRMVALLLTLGLLAASSDPLAHALAGSAGFFLGLFYPQIWEFLRERAEAVANSWKEWVIGPVRIINHGFYAGAGAFLGILMGSLLAGGEYAFPMVVFAVIGLVCAGLWGQFIEGSDKLKRPFGYYGSVLGIVFATVALHFMGQPVWLILAAFSVFMPWVQAIGRLRCLVNGCCHGAPANDRLGIRYVHPRSRVCFISGLKGKPLHPTPLYAILWLGLLGAFQLRLWLGGAELSLIFGLYLILTGLGRFVEEEYRGEPQTPVWRKLRLYQWAAVVTVLVGIVLTVIPAPMPELHPVMDLQALLLALLMGAFAQFLMGIDFPGSERRFSRLT